MKIALAIMRFLGWVAPGLAARLALYFFLTPRVRWSEKGHPPILDEARPFQFAYGSMQLPGLHWGQSGPVVILIHGWEGDKSNMLAFVPPLIERGFQVVAFDAPAHGEAPGHSTSLLEFTHALEALIEKLGPVRAVVGHSLGGPASAILLHEKPTIAIERMVVIGSPVNFDRVLERFRKQVRISPRAVKKWRGLFAKRFGRAIEEFSLQLYEPSIPVLIVHDRLDREVPFDDTEAMAKQWKDATFLPTRGLGHRRILRSAEVGSAVSAFVAGDEKCFSALRSALANSPLRHSAKAEG